MCKICKNIDKLTKDEALAFIGKAMSKGKDPKHFEAVIDKLLGLKEVKDNKELDEIWENNKRG